MVREGPDEGRCTWQLNTESGAPPNPERINRRPDIPRRFSEYLKQVRNEIHGPDKESGDTPRLKLRQVIDLRCVTPVELAVASALLNHAYRTRAERSPALRGSSLTLLTPQGADGHPTNAPHT